MKKTILIAAVLFFALSLSASAQVAYTVASEALSKIACCGLAEPTGTIVFSTQFGTQSPTIAGTISATYNVPIANPTALTIVAKDVTGTPITVTGLTAAVTPNTSTVVITIPAAIPSPHSIELGNVRVNVAGSAFCNTNSTVVASLTSTGNRLTVGETQNITTVLGVAQPLSTPTVTFSPANTEVAIDASNGAVTGTATITVTEAFPTAFGTGSETGRTQAAVIRLTAVGIPTGVSIVFPQTVPGFETSNPTGSAAFGGDVTVTKASPVVYYRQTGVTNGAALESLTVTPTIIATGTGVQYPLMPGGISISAAMAPITTASTATLFPQFTGNCETAAVEIARVQGVLTTTLLVPYAVQAGDYQTGIVVSNTTLDPGTVAMGQYTTAIPQKGKVVVYFFPSDPSKSVASWVSTDHKTFGGGLDSDGLLRAGAQFTAMLNQLFPTGTTDFSGYLFIVTDFTNAHGEFFISNFDNFTHGALMLVVNNAINFASGAGRTQEQGLDQ